MRCDLVGLERRAVRVQLVEDPSGRLALDSVAQVEQRARLLSPNPGGRLLNQPIEVVRGAGGGDRSARRERPSGAMVSISDPHESKAVVEEPPQHAELRASQN